MASVYFDNLPRSAADIFQTDTKTRQNSRLRTMTLENVAADLDAIGKAAQRAASTLRHLQTLQASDGSRKR